MFQNFFIPGFTKIQLTIEEMKKSTVSFYLTGSRFFGGANENSDYDFFASESAVKFLESLGFVKIPNSGYNDDSTIAVYRLADKSGQIDIQIVDNCHKKNLAQIILRDLKVFNSEMSKSERTHKWDVVLRGLNAK